MIAAYSEYNRLSCAAHNLATVLRHLLDEKFLKVHAPGILKGLEVGRNVVGFLKRTGLCRLLPHSVKSLLEVRWDTVVDFLISLIEAFPHIVTILTEKNEQHRLEDWDGELMSETCELLVEFKKVTKEIQAKKVPTIQNIVVRYHDLLDHCEPTDDESEEITTLKKKAADLLKEKLILRDEHYIGAVLCPNIRSLRNCDLQERVHAHSLVLSKMKEISIPQGLEANTQGPPPKKSRFGSWEDEGSNMVTPEEEFELYLKTGKRDDDDPATLLAWWKGKATLFPRLPILAKRTLVIPGTSGNSERNFSRAGLIVNDKRSQISPQNVDDTLVIHNYYLSLNPNSSEEKEFFTEDLQGS